MKTDTIFYSLFQEFPRFFFELIDRPSDEAAAYEFTSPEIKQLAFRPVNPWRVVVINFGRARIT
jgi:predicted transposase YdaD